jgi:pimeloyl-ACP methyl ester carboxylesterase
MRVLTRAAAAIDAGVIRLMERRSRRTPRAPRVRDPRERLTELAAHYSDGTLGLPSAFFPAPAPIALERTRAGAGAGAGPHESAVWDLRFASEYRPFLADYRDEHQRHRENLTAHARLWSLPRGARGAARPTVILLHGWGGGAYWVTERAFAVEYWLRHGLDVVAFQLPLHGHRTPAGRRSGQLFLSPHVVRTNEAFGQAIHDLRGLADALRADGAPAVGAMGMSLGGYTTALWASLDPELAFAVAMIPAVSMAELMWRHGEDSPDRKRAVAAGVSRDLLADVFAVHAPTTRPARLARERLMIIAGRGDRITPPEQAERLHAHWGGDLHWFAGGHLAQVGRADALRAVRRRLGELGLTATATAT